ncbi:SDR family oxidoreductase [Nocardia sp. 2]|uniref:SDR family oxidoreductase n=1 Tax=Nocardia acididurans TaxID=2802282 RepID=A0ABS1MCL4_9NOCA|nr:SDR family oxidoreductase [Nocardia acididurans]MBL1078322.1 SDR family oxidoreductase [Nocardia acididurans]
MTEKPSRVMLTGVTGLIGGALAIELLKETDAQLLCLVRTRPGSSAQQRLLDSLRLSAQAYGTPLSAEELARCTAVAGDITEPLAGVDLDAHTGGVDEFWHSAASLAFEEHRAAEIEKQNVEGTENVLELARGLGVRTFNYISTAYVAGRTNGVIPEARIPASVESNNAYERSKIAAENTVLDSGFDTIRIFRPSIVIGHSRTYAATTFSGLYGFVRGLQRARNLVRASLGDLLKFRPLRLLANGDTPVNFIPVDQVVRAAVGIAARSSDSEIYHLANSAPPALKTVWDGAVDVLGVQYPIFTDDRSEFTLIDEKVDEQMDFYRSYMNDEKYFSVSNVEKILGEGALRCELSAQELGRYVAWYLAHRGAA